MPATAAAAATGAARFCLFLCPFSSSGLRNFAVTLRISLTSFSAAFVSLVIFESIQSRLKGFLDELKGAQKLTRHIADGCVHIVASFSSISSTCFFISKSYCGKGTKKSTLTNFSASTICDSFSKHFIFSWGIFIISETKKKRERNEQFSVFIARKKRVYCKSTFKPSDVQ